MITLDTMPALDESSHTIIGRLFKGKETMRYLEGMNEYRSSLDFIKKRIRTTPLGMGTENNPKLDNQTEEIVSAGPDLSRIVIKDSGVYKFSRSDSQMIRTSAAGAIDFRPDDFLDARNRR